MRIISTQIPEQFVKLKSLLGDKVESLNAPMIRIESVEANNDVLNEIKQVSDCNYLVFTSKRGVQCFFELYDKAGIEREIFNNLKFACIGESTGNELIRFGFRANYINPGNTSIDFSKYLIKEVLKAEDKVFLPLGNMANNYLPSKLAEFCDATRVNVYNTVGVDYIDGDILDIIKREEYNLLVFTSPSAIDNFIKLTAFKPETNNLKIASIGETTNQAIEKCGFKTVLTASKSNLETMANEILEFIT